MKTAVVAFGRMNPPTIGHKKLVDKLKSVAQQKRGTPLLYLSHSQDKKKNPLSYDQKLAFARKAFGSVVTKSTAKTLLQVMKELEGKGFTDAVIIAGSDRVSEFQTLLDKYNGKEFNMSSVKVISAGERDPDAEGVEGMSASKLRALAQRGDFETFAKGIPLSKPEALKLYNNIRSVMEGIEMNEARLLGKNMTKDALARDTEESDREYIAQRKFKSQWKAKNPNKPWPGYREAGFNEEQEMKSVNLQAIVERVLTLQQRQKKRMQMKKNAPRIARLRKLKLQRVAQKPALIKRARKAAVLLLKKRVAGEQGLNYASLSPSQKIQIDRMVEKKLPMVDRIAKRLLPKIMKKELERIKSLRSGGNK